MWMFVISKHNLLTSDIDLCFFMCERGDRLRGVRRRAFLCKYLPLCIKLSLYCSLSTFKSALLKGLGTSWQIIRDPGNQSKYLSKNQPKLSFLQNFEIWFWKTFNLLNLLINLSPSQFELLVSLNYCTFHSFLPFSVPGAKSLFLVARPYVIICLQPVPQ